MKMFKAFALLLTFLTVNTWGEDTWSISDNHLLEAIEDELRADDVVTADVIDVAVHAGVVTVSGDAHSILAKRRVVALLQNLRGVRSIINRLHVLPSGERDEQIRDEVWAGLKEDPVTKSLDIKITVQRGRVTLDGSVESFALSHIAESTVAGIRGVTEIDNKIRVEPIEHRTDSNLKLEILRRLELHPFIDEQSVLVEVKDGSTAISGQVGSLGEKTAAELMCWVRGVRDVRSEGLAVNPDVAKKRRRSKFIKVRNDLEIKRAVEDALIYDPRIRGSQIGVRVRLAAVTLFGNVSSYATKQAAERNARNTIGVRRVVNHLKVRVPDWPGDLAVTDQVRKALSRDVYLGGSKVHASSHFGKVYLTGEVNTQFESDRAEYVVANVPSTRGVVNRVRVDAEWLPKRDADILEDLRRRLRLSPYLFDTDEIAVDVDDGVVTLYGNVDTWHQRNEVLRCAGRSGAKRVKDSLNVLSSGSAPKDLKATVIVHQSEYKLAAEQQGEKFRKLLEAAKKRRTTSDLPPAPVVHLTLRLINEGDEPILLRIGHDQGGFTLSLTGQGAVHVPDGEVFAANFRAGHEVTIAPSRHIDLPIESLEYGFRGESERWYWTEPGDYTLQASFTWPLDMSGLFSQKVAATPVRLSVKAQKKEPK